MTASPPIVYDKNGNPMRLRVVAGEYVGEVSGEGHYAFEVWEEPTKPTIYFEEINCNKEQ